MGGMVRTLHIGVGSTENDAILSCKHFPGKFPLPDAANGVFDRATLLAHMNALHGAHQNRRGLQFYAFLLSRMDESHDFVAFTFC